MFFKNFQIFRMLKAWPFTAEQLEQRLTKFAFAEAMSTQVENMGWVPPRKNGTLVHTVNRQYLLSLCFEKKLLPPSVVNQVVRARAEEIEEQQGFKPGRRQMKELKETVTDELLPRAFSINSTVGVWIDPINGWLAVNTGSASRREAVFKMLLKALDTLPVEALRAERSPLSAMTDWLASDEVPAGFTVDQETELRATNEGKATVRYVRHTLEADDVRRHIAAGKRCTRLAMTWSDRISFVLNEDLVLKRVAPLDVLKEPAGTDAKNAEELFDSEFAMMSGEMARLLKDLTGALGGVRTADSELVQ